MTHFMGPQLEDRVHQGTNVLQVSGFWQRELLSRSCGILQQSFRVNVPEERLGT